MKIDIISSKFIKPSLPTPPTLKTHQLSFFDQLAPPAYPGIIYFFPSNTTDHTQLDEETSKKLDQLEQSLSEVLTRYYPFAGKFIKEDSLVECNDQGVQVLEARVRDRLDRVDHENPDPELLYGLVPGVGAMIGSSMSPVTAIQVSVFACGGVAVGMRTSHKVADGYSAITFLKEWATANKDGIDEAIKPSFELGSVFPARDMSVLKPRPPLQRKKLVVQKFEIDEQNLSALKAEATCPDSGWQPSRIVAVSALIWRTLIQISESNNGKLRDSLLTISIDLRGGRCGVEVPKAAFGNLYCTATARFEAAKNEIELHKLAKLIKEGITKTTQEYGKVRNADDTFTKLVEFEEMVASEKSGDTDIYNFSSLSRFSGYEMDFGFGKPVWVTVVPSNVVELVSIMESKTRGGIEVWLTLNENDMAQFQRHRDMVAVSTLGSIPNNNSNSGKVPASEVREETNGSTHSLPDHNSPTPWKLTAIEANLLPDLKI